MSIFLIFFPYSFDELINTGLTRAKHNLFFINFGNNDFDYN